MAERAVTLDQLVNHAGARLRAAGLNEPKREAWRIWSDLVGTTWFTGSIFSDQAVPEDQAARFRDAVDRRALGEPLPYVTGVAGFRQLTLRSDRRALIPRPETEGVVEWALKVQATGMAVDVGTGSGCLALALAEEGEYDFILGVDRSAEALALAEENRRATGLGIDLVRANLVEALTPRSFDLLVSNPPYLTEAEYQRLDPAVRAWEPESALVGGPEGIEVTRTLLQEALPILRPGGWLVLEVDTTRATATARLADAGGWCEVAVHDDLYGRARYLLARRNEAE
jgi:release factor glutamine methyltransferase